MNRVWLDEQLPAAFKLKAEVGGLHGILIDLMLEPGLDEHSWCLMVRGLDEDNTFRVMLSPLELERANFNVIIEAITEVTDNLLRYRRDRIPFEA